MRQILDAKTAILINLVLTLQPQRLVIKLSWQILVLIPKYEADIETVKV